jgi:hypothetical protein
MAQPVGNRDSETKILMIGMTAAFEQGNDPVWGKSQQICAEIAGFLCEVCGIIAVLSDGES